MSDASQWRLQLARQLAPLYAQQRGVRAVILGGSAAEGHADRYSDVELGVFWQHPPSDADRRLAAERAGGVQLTLDAYDSRQDVGIEDYYVDQVNIDVVHRSIAGTDRLIAEVIDQYDATLHKQTLIHALRHAVPLLDDPVLAAWRRRTDHYPDALVRSVVDAQLRFKPWWSVEVLAERNSLILVHYALCMVTERLVAALMAINRQYFAGLKWLPRSVAALQLAPHDLETRLEHCFKGALETRVRGVAALVDDTFDLAAQVIPELALDARRAAFHERRPPVDTWP